jgi:hypothetical protein
MAWWQYILLYLCGMGLASFFRGLWVPKPSNHNFHADWEMANIIFPAIWPVYMPGMLMWNVGNTFRQMIEDK